MISVSLKTPLKNKMGNPYLQNFTSASARRLYLLYIKLSPHISQQNCAHGWNKQQSDVNETDPVATLHATIGLPPVRSTAAWPTALSKRRWVPAYLTRRSLM